MTRAQFKKKFKTEINEHAAFLWRQDKDHFFANKAACKEAAIEELIESHTEITIVD